jgi:hypothetical protein
MNVHTEIRRHYEAYGQAFSGGDPDASVGYWHAPSIRTGPEGVRLDAAVADRRAGFAAAIEDLDATTYDHSEGVAICSHALSDSVALSNVVWHRLTDDGGLQARFSPLHVLCRPDEDWRFVARATRRSDAPIAMRPASAAPDDTGTTPAGLEGTLAEHARAVSAGDDGAVAAAWHDPALVVAPEVEVVEGTAEADPVLGEGAVEVAAVHAHELDDGVAVADVVWERETGETATLALLHRADEGWRFVAVGEHPAEHAVAIGRPE